MSRRSFALLAILTAACFVLTAPPAVHADDYSYARVVRLSLIQGEAQVAHPDIEGWEQAVVNMPIEQGYTIATGQGRVEIEFESGMTARLAENSTLQFTELALSDGARITKLTLTQGTATFYANLASHDVFSVATPSVEVSVPESARFRLDVYADGSAVNVLKGSVDVNSSAGTHRVSKGSTLSFRTNDPDEVTIARSGAADDWDKWVASREDVIQAGNNAASQYVNSPYSYGLSDLYTYGSWYPIDGYGYGWRPYGATLGWTPFMTGAWGYCPGFGLSWTSYEPWGWLPYHYGGWIFSPVYGWVWVPGGFGAWNPGVVRFVRVGGQVGFVPLHPHDQPGQAPGNLQHGVIVPGAHGLPGGGGRPGAPQTELIGAKSFQRIPVADGGKVEVLGAAPREFISGRHATLDSAPGASQGKAALSANGGAAPGPARAPEAPGIVFDQREHRWINNPGAPVNSVSAPAAPAMKQAVPPQMPGPAVPLRQDDLGPGRRALGPEGMVRSGGVGPAGYAPKSQMTPRTPDVHIPAAPSAPSRTFVPPPPAPHMPSYAPSGSAGPRPMSPSPSGPAPGPHFSPPPPPSAPAVHSSPPPPPPPPPPKSH